MKRLVTSKPSLLSLTEYMLSAVAVEKILMLNSIVKQDSSFVYRKRISSKESSLQGQFQ